jgi:metallo-beta-lactamase family protein
VRANGINVLFGGDLGRYDRPVLPDPSRVEQADFLLVESTYGNRQHPPEDDGEPLAHLVRDTVERRGRLIVPSFAIGRVEEVLYWIKRLEDEKRIPVVPVWVDSPMATEALVQYGRRLEELDPDITIENGPRRHRKDVAAFATTRMQIVASPQQSRELVQSRGPAIVISSSGMATGGRVLHHLAAALPRAENAVLFVGFQAAGTRGRRLIEGATSVRIHGADVPVAARIEHLDSMSAHADANEIMRWLRGFTRPPSSTYIVHGEPDASLALEQRIRGELGWNVAVAQHGQQVELQYAQST